MFVSTISPSGLFVCATIYAMSSEDWQTYGTIYCSICGADISDEPCCCEDYDVYEADGIEEDEL